MNDKVVSVQSTGYNPCCTPVGEADSGGGVCMWRQGIMGRTLCTFLLSCAVNPKLLQKNKVYLKNKEGSLKLCFKIYFVTPETAECLAKQNKLLGNNLVLTKCSLLSDILLIFCPPSFALLTHLSTVSSLIACMYPYLTQNYLLSSRLFYPKVSKKSHFECP